MPTIGGVPGYPVSPALTVDILLKQPQLIVRNLTALTNKRFVADAIFARGSAQQVAGGSVRYQRSESIFPDRDAEERAISAEYPRTTWSEEVLTAVVSDYGLEVEIKYESVRRNQMDVMDRALIKLANALTRFVDTKAMNLLTTDTDVLTAAASGDWSTAATDIVKDIATAQKGVTDQDEGYMPTAMIVNPAQELDLRIDKDIRDALPRETQSANQLGGMTVPAMLGLTEILVTPRLAAGTVLIGQPKLVGSIADEQPDPREGYVTDSRAGAQFAPIYVKVYEEPARSQWVVRAVRFPAMWLSEPKSFFKITAA